MASPRVDTEKAWLADARFDQVRGAVHGAGAGQAAMFRLASLQRMAFLPGPMSSLPTADLLALDTAGLKSRLSKLRRYL